MSLWIVFRDDPARGESPGVAGARVRLEGSFAELAGRDGAGLLSGELSIERATDERGRASFDELTSGAAFRIGFRAPGLGDDWQFDDEPVPPLAPGERGTRTLVARGTTDVHGVARDQDGEPAAGVELLLVRDDGSLTLRPNHQLAKRPERTATADADGRFVWEALGAGRWAVYPLPLRDKRLREKLDPPRPEPVLDTLFAVVPTRFELRGYEGTRVLVLELTRGLYVSGRVLGPAGEPAASVPVDAAIGDGEFFLGTATAGDGSFVLGPLPDRPVLLDVPFDRSGGVANDVLAHAGDTDVVVQLVAGGTLQLHTRDGASGRGVVCNFDALLTNASGEVVYRASYSNGSADFEWSGLSPGTWSFLARGPSGRMALASGLELRSGETTGPVELSLEPGGMLVVVRPISASLSSVRIEVRLGGAPVLMRRLHGGQRLETTLPAGLVELEVWEGSERLEARSLWVVAGEQVAVELGVP